MAQVGLEHLTKVFQGPGGQTIPAVNDACLVVHAKELLVLVGPSGCGKTTTLRLVAGLEEPTAGTILLNGQVVNHLPPKKRDMAMVFQHHALYPHMSVYDNMAFGLKLRHCPRAEIDQRVKEAAQVLDLTASLDRRPDALSGGQCQRVALGRALVRRPQVFLLDEPLSNLDAQTRLQMRAEIVRLQARLGATMIYVTHDQVEALTVGHRVAVMKDGFIQQVAAPMDVYEHPANLFVAGFIGSPPMNFFDGTLSASGDVLIFQECSLEGAPPSARMNLPVRTGSLSSLRTYAGRKVVCGVRPEHLACRPLSPGQPAEHEWQAAVEVVQPLGSETYLHFAGRAKPVVARVAATERFSASQKIMASCSSQHAHFFDPSSGAAII